MNNSYIFVLRRSIGRCFTNRECEPNEPYAVFANGQNADCPSTLLRTTVSPYARNNRPYKEITFRRGRFGCGQKSAIQTCCAHNAFGYLCATRLAYEFKASIIRYSDIPTVAIHRSILTGELPKPPDGVYYKLDYDVGNHWKFPPLVPENRISTSNAFCHYLAIDNYPNPPPPPAHH